MRNIDMKRILASLLAVALLASCEKAEYKIPDPISELTNDCIKRTLGPNIATLPIEFVYA